MPMEQALTVPVTKVNKEELFLQSLDISEMLLAPFKNDPQQFAETIQLIATTDPIKYCEKIVIPILKLITTLQPSNQNCNVVANQVVVNMGGNDVV